MIEINLATFDKQEEILSSFGGGETLMYMLAKADSTASQSDIEALKDIPHIKNIINSEAALRAIIGSRGCVSQIFSSENARENVFNSETAMAIIAKSAEALNLIINSEDYLKILVNSNVAINELLKSKEVTATLINSDRVLNALLNSTKCKCLNERQTITGRFLPLQARSDSYAFQAYNGKWSDIGGNLGGWLKANSSNAIATQIKNGVSDARSIYYYDLNA